MSIFKNRDFLFGFACGAAFVFAFLFLLLCGMGTVFEIYGLW